jgi:uncharacterized membrane protein
MSAPWIGALHVAACAAALLLGTAMAAAPKGTRWHRQVGRAFVASMLVLNFSALGTYRLTGGFNGFHAFALFSLATLAAGWWCARRARGNPGLREVHGWIMLWSYAGLLAAAASELAVRLPFLPRGGMAFGATVAAATLLVCAVAAIRIERTMRRHRSTPR